MQRIFDQATDLQAPVLRLHIRLHAEIEHRPSLHFLLARRQTVDMPEIVAIAAAPVPPPPLIVTVGADV